MKLNKLLMVSAATFTSLMALTACPKEKATADQLEAVEKALKQTVLTESAAGSPLVPGTPADLEGEKNTTLELTKFKKGQKVSSGAKLDVEFEWSYDSSYESLIRAREEKDEAHDLIKFNYHHARTDASGDVIDYKTEYDTDEFKLKCVAKCGPATLEKEFIANLKHNAAVYDPISMADVYRLNGAGTAYAWQQVVDGEISPKNIQGNHKQNFYFVEVSGKVEYISPDKNWGLMSDGNRMVELYRVDECQDKAFVEPGEYITVKAEVSHYKGNVQLSFVRFVEKMADHSAILDRVDYGELPAKMNVDGDAAYVAYCSGDANRIGQLSNVTVKTIDTSTFNKGARFTFDVTKDGQDFTIAYDYHTGAHDSDVGNDLAQAIKSLSVGSTVTVKGTLRYVATNGDDEPFSKDGAWQLTPYRTGDIVKVS